MHDSVTFPSGTVNYLFQSSFEVLGQQVEKERAVIVTDSNIAALYTHLLEDYMMIIIPAGEDNKTWPTVASIVEQLITLKAHRKTYLIGLGGGVVTDITGFAASIYMRGIPFGFIPTSLLGMVDAAVGGKNGVNKGLHKNLLGVFRQPRFVLYDHLFLQTLPDGEWSNGFAEIIKYACIFDAPLFDELCLRKIDYYKESPEALDLLISRCVQWKNKTVLHDEKESDLRRLLNFGHTCGHAFETLYHLAHGSAVSIGMIIATIVSEQTSGLSPAIREKLVVLLKACKLPVVLSFNTDDVMNLLQMDKKRNNNEIDFVVLETVGHAAVKTIPFDVIEKALTTFLSCILV